MKHGKNFFVKSRTLEPMKEFYNSIDCLVLASKSECMPRTILEAMACGLPVISTDVGSVSMLLNKKWLIPSNDENFIIFSMNKKLKLLKENYSLRKKIGKGIENLLVNILIGKIINLYGIIFLMLFIIIIKKELNI